MIKNNMSKKIFFLLLFFLIIGGISLIFYQKIFAYQEGSGGSSNLDSSILGWNRVSYTYSVNVKEDDGSINVHQVKVGLSCVNSGDTVQCPKYLDGSGGKVGPKRKIDENRKKVLLYCPWGNEIALLKGGEGTICVGQTEVKAKCTAEGSAELSFTYCPDKGSYCDIDESSFIGFLRDYSYNQFPSWEGCRTFLFGSNGGKWEVSGDRNSPEGEIHTFTKKIDLPEPIREDKVCDLTFWGKVKGEERFSGASDWCSGRDEKDCLAGNREDILENYYGKYNFCVNDTLFSFNCVHWTTVFSYCNCGAGTARRCSHKCNFLGCDDDVMRKGCNAECINHDELKYTITYKNNPETGEVTTEQGGTTTSTSSNSYPPAPNPEFNIGQRPPSPYPQYPMRGACDCISSDPCPGGLVPCGRSCDDPNTATNECCFCTICHLFILISRIIDFLVTKIAIPLLALMAMVSAVLFLTAHGNPEWILRGKRAITSAIVGFAIVVLSWTIINTIIFILVEGKFPSLTGGGVAKIFGTMWNEISCDPGSSQSGSGSGSGGSSGGGSGNQNQMPQAPQNNQSASQQNTQDNVQQEINQVDASQNNQIDGLNKGGGQTGSFLRKAFSAINFWFSREPIIKKLNEVLPPKEIGIQNARLGSRFNLNFHYNQGMNKVWTSTMGAYYDDKTSFIVSTRLSDGSLHRFPPSDQWYSEYDGSMKVKDPSGGEKEIKGIGVEVQPDRQRMYSVHLNKKQEPALYISTSTISPFAPSNSFDDFNFKMSIAPFFYQEVAVYNPTEKAQRVNLLVSVDYATGHRKSGNGHIIEYQHKSGADRGGKRALVYYPGAKDTVTWAIGVDNVFRSFENSGNLPNSRGSGDDYNPGGMAVSFVLEPGQLVKKVFIYAGHNGGTIMQDQKNNKNLNFYYTKFFKSLDDVIIYASSYENYTQIMKKTTDFVNSVNSGTGLVNDSSARWIFAQALHSYFGNTFLLKDARNVNDVRYYVHEGGFQFLSTVDVAHEVGIFEGIYIPWALKLQLKHWAEYNKNNCNSKSLEAIKRGEKVPGCDEYGIFLQHDMGGNLTVLPHQRYEFNDGGKMAAEENLNYILLNYWYWKKTGDKTLISEYKGFIRELLTSLTKRDSNGDGIIDIKDYLDRTTFDFGETPLSFTNGNIYIGIKSFGAFIAAGDIFKALGETSTANLYYQKARTTKNTLTNTINTINSQYGNFHFPTSIDYSLQGWGAPSSVIFDGLTYLILTGSNNGDLKNFLAYTGKSLLFNIKHCKTDRGYRLIASPDINNPKDPNIDWRKTWLSKTFNAASMVKYLKLRNIINSGDFNASYFDIFVKAKELLKNNHAAFSDSWYADTGRRDPAYLNMYPRGVSIIGINFVK